MNALAIQLAVFPDIQRIQGQLVIALINTAKSFHHVARTLMGIENIGRNIPKLRETPQQMQDQGGFAGAGRGEHQIIAEALRTVADMELCAVSLPARCGEKPHRPIAIG